MTRYFSIILAGFLLLPAEKAEAQHGEDRVTLRTGLQVSTADRLPFWLYANRLGKVDPAGANFFSEFAVKRTLWEGDRFSVSAGGSLLGRLSPNRSVHFPTLHLQADYGAFRLEAGRFPQPIGTNNHRLSVGSMMVSTHATPVPKVSIITPEFVDVPGLGGHLQFRGLFAHGWFPDSRFVEDVKLHQKFLYLRINLDRLSLTGGIVHNNTWGGTHPRAGRLSQSFTDYLKIITGIGMSGEGDTPEQIYNSALGNSLAAYEFDAEYRFGNASLSLTRLFYLEDVVSTRFRSPWDGVWGVNLKREGNHWLKGLTYEHVNTKQQDSRPDQPSGRQMYYYNFIYQSGWTHEDRVLGIPLITFNPEIDRPSNNMVVAHHLGIGGRPWDGTEYRAFLTYSRNYGTFEQRRYGEGEEDFYSLEEMRRDNLSLYLGVSWELPGTGGLSLQVSAAADTGEFYGNALGTMVGLRWDGRL